ncbi:signal transduction histidine kinase [Aequitasia blattaphilus]|uniref:Heme sensor protein HssS n=1 Tax=Aequitasia blattaphilus TaxID=2949332 RepID=A0ABT1EBY1_9FIRM|nr:HAMP domain-containing sensor histidine kinase [Aequitasia blattaphilus]MCP1103181.1 HAMP domain-containing histidine kinase [Aequitasia blattaphilus]MCR8615821.1 HAMP domain-containing histidine kinase [Aequitasia blattaphilus]
MNKLRTLVKHFSMLLIFTAFIFVIMSVSMFLVFGGMNLLIRSETFQRPMYFFAAISLLVAVFMAIFFGRRPLKTWHILTGAANEIASGNYNVRVEPKDPEVVKDLFQSFNHMAKELGSVEILRSDFINNFSHEFKTPIVSIKGFAKMLKRNDLTTEEREEYLDIIISESERLSSLANSVLSLSKIEQQTILTRREYFNVSKQIRLVIAMMLSKWPNKNVNIIFDSDEIYLSGDEELLRQVWLNLMDNAIKFSPDGGEVTIQILSEMDDVTILFCNQGPDMTPETANHLFDKFYQGDASRTTAGNGLGLTIVRQIITLHGGTIQVKDADSTGTVFEIVLPKR